MRIFLYTIFSLCSESCVAAQFYSILKLLKSWANGFLEVLDSPGSVLDLSIKKPFRRSESESETYLGLGSCSKRAPFRDREGRDKDERKRALEQREKMEASGSDSEEDRMKEESRKNMKLTKKMKGDLAVSGKGEGEIEWQRDSDVQHKKWGGDFSFGNPSGLAIRGGLGYESRSEKKSVKGKAKFSF